MNKQILIALTLCILFAGIASANGETSAIIGIGSGYGSVTMPISVVDGANVGSVDVTLTFDPTIVTVTKATNSDMDGMFANLENVRSGWIRIVGYQVSNPGLDGTFDIAQVTFKSVSSSGSCPLGIAVTTFKDSTPTGNVMAYSVSNGTYTATSSGGGGDGTYPPDPTPTEGSNVTPTETPTETPSPIRTPTPTPTKILPNGDDIDDDMTELGKIVMAIVALFAAAAAIIIKTRNKK